MKGGFKMLIKKSCKCGTKILVKRPEFGTAPTPICGYCKTYGIEKSKEIAKKFKEQF